MAEEKQTKRNKNIHLIRTPHGPIEKMLPHVYPQKGVAIFESPLGELISRGELEGIKSGEILEKLMATALARPEYLVPDDVSRTASLIQNLGDFEYEVSGFAARQIKGGLYKISDLPLSLLGFAAREWIFSFFQGGQHPLLASYALATSMFIDRHLNGDSFYGGQEHAWKIVGFVEPDQFERRSCGFNFINDKKFKSDFTKSMGEILVSFAVPEPIVVTCTPMYSAELSLMRTITMLYKRCFLSEDWYDHYSGISIENYATTKFDIYHDFSLPGGVFYCPEEEGRGYPLVRGDLPARWIQGVVEPDLNGTLRPIPDWLR